MVKGLSNLILRIPKKMVYRFATDKFFDRYALKIWKKIFIEVAKNTDDIDEKLAKQIAHSRSIQRLYYSMFYFPKNLLDVENLILAVCMETLDCLYKINKQVLIQYVIAAREYWIEELLENEILRVRFEKKTGKNIYELRDKPVIISTEILDIISDNTKLRKTFFSSYSSNNEFDSCIRIFLPNEDGFVDWKKELSVDIRFNLFLGFELGFFRIGYDYALLPNDNSAWVVTYSKNRKREAVIFKNKKVGKLTGACIWAR